MSQLADHQTRHINVMVTNPCGLHLRCCATIARVAMQFNAQASIHRENRQANATSILELMTLGAPHGVELGLRTVGPDADQLLNALLECLQSDGVETFA